MGLGLGLRLRVRVRIRVRGWGLRGGGGEPLERGGGGLVGKACGAGQLLEDAVDGGGGGGDVGPEPLLQRDEDAQRAVQRGEAAVLGGAEALERVAPRAARESRALSEGEE